MSEGISAGRRERRLRREAFGEVGQTYIQNARRKPKSTQRASAEEGAKRSVPDRTNSGGPLRAIRASEISLGQIAEAVAQGKRSAPPRDFLVNIHLLQQSRALTVPAV